MPTLAMEENNRRKRENRSRPNSPAHHRKSDHRRKNADEIQRDLTTEKRMKHRHKSGVLSVEAVEKVLAVGDDVDHIRDWLTQIDTLDPTTSKTSYAAQTLPNYSTADNQLPVQIFPLGIRFPPHAALDAEAHMSKSRKHYRNSTSDSSLLEPAESDPRAGDSIQAQDRKTVTSIESRRFHSRRRRGETSMSEESAASSHPKEVFEKRPRRKTREDLYESKKQRTEPKEKKHGEGRSHRRREKKGDQRRAAKKAAEALMNNFTSKKIDQERLSMRPSNRLGLFKNGRASSPAKRRGVPNLAFSEMEFLQRYSNPQSMGRGEKPRSKSREKDKRKTERAREEISGFFKTKTGSLEELSASSYNARLSEFKSHRLPIHEQQSRRADIEQSNLIGIQDENDRLPCYKPSFHLPNESGQPISMDKVRADGTKSPSIWSGKATTCVTWSETQNTTHTTAMRRLGSVRQPSPAPDFVRASIERSGILRDTGISLTPELTGFRTDTPITSSAHKSVVSEKTHALRRGITSNNTIVGTAASDKRSTVSTLRHADSSSNNKGKRSELVDSTRVDRRHPQRRMQDEERCFGNDAQVPLRGTKRVIVEYFDPDLGWHQRQKKKTLDNSSFQISTGDSKSPPPSRREIARWARIKRPSKAAYFPGETDDKAYTDSKEILTGTVPVISQAEQAYNITPLLPHASIPGSSLVVGKSRELQINAVQGSIAESSQIPQEISRPNDILHRESELSLLEGTDRFADRQPLGLASVVDPAQRFFTHDKQYSPIQRHRSRTSCGKIDKGEFGLPLRGSCIDNGQGFISRTTLSLLRNEPTSLYLHQMHNRTLPQTEQVENNGGVSRVNYCENSVAYPDDYEPTYLDDNKDGRQGEYYSDLYETYYNNEEGVNVEWDTGNLEHWPSYDIDDAGPADDYGNGQGLLISHGEGLRDDWNGERCLENGYVGYAQGIDHDEMNLTHAFWRTWRNN